MTTRAKQPIPGNDGPGDELEASSMPVIVPLVFGAAIVVAAFVLWNAHAKKIAIAESARIEEQVRAELREAYRHLREHRPEQALATVKTIETQMDALPINWVNDYSDLKVARLMMEAEAIFILDKSGSAEKAETLFNQALGLISHASGELWLFGVFGRGRVRFELGRYEDAIADFDNLLSRNPSFGAAYYWRSLAYAKIGQTAQAMTDGARAKSLDSWPPLRDFVRSGTDENCRDFLTRPRG